MLYFTLLLLLIVCTSTLTPIVFSYSAAPHLNGTTSFRVEDAELLTTDRQTRSATVHFSGRDVHLYKNGIEIAICHDPTSFVSEKVTLARGDILSFNAEDIETSFGMIAAIEYEGGEFVGTGREKDFWTFRAVKELAEFNANQPWMRSTYNDICDWLPAQPFPELRQNNNNLARGFPFAQSGARFVWTAVGEDDSFIHVRYTEGGQRCPGSPGRLHYVGRDVHVYLNGIEHAFTHDPTTTRTLYIFPRDGDAVALWAEDTVPETWAVRAALVMDDGSQWLTGQSGSWRATRQSAGFRPNQEWQMADFEICEWRPAALSRRFEPTWGRGFPVPAARYVWADGVPGDVDIYLRTTIGFKDCDPNTPSTLYISGKDVHIFVNGEEKDFIHDAGSTKRIPGVVVKQGDTVALWALDDTAKHGLFAAVVLPDGRTFATGKSGGWRARKMYTDYEDPAWSSPGVQDRCTKWRLPKLVSDYKTTSVKDYPAGTGAQHVWAPDAGPNDEIFMRLDVGIHCATLYATGPAMDVRLNGARISQSDKPASFVSIPLSVKNGDAITVQASDKSPGRFFGVAAALVYDDEEVTTYVTGQEPFRATAVATAGDDWVDPEDDAVCNWSDVVAVPKDPARGKGFPFGSSGAKFVWAAGLGKSTPIAMRMRVGGEPACLGAQSMTNHLIIYDSRAPTTVYVNGLKHSAQPSIGHQRLEVRMKPGDVVSLLVKGSSARDYGVIAAVIELDSRQTARSQAGTGSGAWRAARYTGTGQLAKNEDGCRWSRPQSRASSYPDDFEFPACSTGSQYVWAAGALGLQDVVLRHRVGASC